MREEADGWNKRQERSDDGLKEMSNEELPQVKFWEEGQLKYKQSRFINAGEMVVGRNKWKRSLKPRELLTSFI